MGCKKKTTQIVKRIARGLKPVLVAHAVSLVTGVEAIAKDTELSGKAKRQRVVTALKAHARALQMEIPGRTINLLVEFAVEAVKGPDSEHDLGMDDTEEMAP